MTSQIPAAQFAGPARAERLERAATALTAHGFTVEVLDDAAAARTRIKDLIPEGASVFTGASETLRYPASRRTLTTVAGTTPPSSAAGPWTASVTFARSGG